MADGIPGFYAAAACAPAWPRLRGAVSAGVCVVGGGMTGIAAARELAARGREVVLVEARRVGWGASGRNGGQAVAGFAPPMERVECLVGRRDARALWDAVRGGLARLDADSAGCGARAGFALAARRRRTLPALAREAERAARLYGYPLLRALDREGLAAHVRGPLFRGGLYDAGAIHLDPLALCRKRAAAAAAAGATLFENSPAVRIDGGAVETREGTVCAQTVVLACNAYAGRPGAPLAARILPVSSDVCVTEPLGAALAEHLMPSGAALCDDRRDVAYFRRTPDHRLLFGAGSRLSGRDAADPAALLRPRIAEIFPELADAAIDHAWSGTLAVTRNRLPDIGRTPGGAYYAQGYSGEGLILADVAGRAIAAAIDGDGAAFDVLRRIPHRALPPLRALWLPLAGLLMRLADRL